MTKRKISIAAAAGKAADDFVNGAPDMSTAGKPRRPRKPGVDYVRMNVELEAEMMAQFKILAIIRGVTIKELVSSLIEQEIAKNV